MNVFDARQATRASRVLQVLQDSYRVSNAVWDELPVAMYICDADGRLVQFNRRACEAWGYKPDLSSGTVRFGGAHKLYHRDGSLLGSGDLPMREVLATGRPRHDEVFILERPDGVRVNILSNMDPVIDSYGAIVGAVNCFQNIDALQPVATDSRVLDRGHELAQRLDAIFEHAHVGIVEADATGRVLRVNDAMCTITGYVREDLVGNTLYNHTHADDAARDRLIYREQVEGGYDRYAIEKRFVRQDGGVIWISVLSSAIRDRDGAFLYCLRLIEDITERKRAEEAGETAN
jgi:PAS domain S-box-containing protein